MKPKVRSYVLPGLTQIEEKYAAFLQRNACVVAARMKSYMCVICGFVYEEEKGRPEEGIPPGTTWEKIPENWKCPDCGAGKSDFEMIEI